MPYVERDSGTNAVKGLYANPQPGYAEEWLEDDDAEVVAFRAPAIGPSPPRDAFAELDALKAALVKKNVVSDSDIEAAETEQATSIDQVDVKA